MELYIAFVILLSVLATFKFPGRVIIAFLLAFIIIGFRGPEVGTDTENYFKNFTNVDANSDYMTRFEYIWNALLVFSTMYLKSYRLFLVIVAFLTLFPLFILSLRTPNPIKILLLYVLLYYFFHSMNIARQSLALTWGMMAFICYKKYFKYAIFIILISMIHTTALIMLAMPLVRHIKLNKQQCIFLLILSFVVGALGATGFIYDLAAYFGSFSLYATENLRQGTFSMTRLFLNIFMIYILLTFKKIDHFVMAIIIGIAILNVLPGSPIIGRLSMYFLILQVFMFSNVSHYNIHKNTNIVIWTYALMSLLKIFI